MFIAFHEYWKIEARLIPKTTNSLSTDKLDLLEKKIVTLMIRMKWKRITSLTRN